MPFFVNESGVSNPLVTNATITVQDIVERVQRDMSKSISGTHPALLDYINRVHLDLLRHSRYRFLISEPLTFTTTAGTAKYYLGASAAPSGSIDSGLHLSDLDMLVETSVANRSTYEPLAKTVDKPLNPAFDLAASPKLWRLNQDQTLELMPPTDQTYSIEFRYIAQIRTLTNSADILQIPNKYLDIIVAGVNELVATYLSDGNQAREDAVAYWNNRYTDGKSRMIRDLNLVPKSGDFIKPSLP